MSLYAIGDLHLSIVSVRRKGFFHKRPHYELYKPMDCFDPVWKDHVDKLGENLHSLLSPEDTIVITGDHSWGRDLASCRKDLSFIENLPGRKILTRGNHDLFWEASRTEWLNEEFRGRLCFLQNNFYSYQDIALVGSKGICFEGDVSFEQFERLQNQEMERLRTSFEAASQAGFEKFVLFLHYPPTSVGENESCFTRLAHEYGVKTVVYSHCHGEKRYHDSLQGTVDGITYHLVSSDYLRFSPIKLLP